MMRALWSAASGMRAEQTSVDTISNNIANVNTTGFKSQSVEFKNLLYQTIQTKTTSANGDTKPGNAQVGLGTRVSSLNTSFTQGAFFASESDTAFAIGGEGFFGIKGGDGKTYYTRNGNFGWTLASNGGNMLATTDGNPVLDEKGNPVKTEYFNFGKYKGKAIKDVLRTDPSYYSWIQQGDFTLNTKQVLEKLRLKYARR